MFIAELTVTSIQRAANGYVYVMFSLEGLVSSVGMHTFVADPGLVVGEKYDVVLRPARHKVTEKFAEIANRNR